MLPIYHPTTTLLLDDQVRFLESLSHAAPIDMPTLPIDNPMEAIEVIKKQNKLTRDIPAEVLQATGVRDPLIVENQLIDEYLLRFNLAMIPAQVQNHERYSTISVIVADYAMPKMDGITFFRQLGNIPQKRILLTGQADEQIAVAAFNDGVIDQFVAKGKPGVIDALYEMVRRYQRDYFSEQYAFLNTAIRMTPESLFGNPHFDPLLQEMYRLHGFVEHYYMYTPDGALLFDEDGKVKRLIAMSEEDMDGAASIVDDEPELKKALLRREVIPDAFLFTQSGGEFAYWKEHVLQAKVFGEDENRLYYQLFDFRGEIDLDKARFYGMFPNRKEV